jgi:hypothetical protein
MARPIAANIAKLPELSGQRNRKGVTRQRGRTMLAWLRQHLKSIVAAVVILLFAAVYIFLIVFDRMQTPEQRAALKEQIRANEARKAEKREVEASVNAAKRELCRQGRMCREYGQARQQCAIAANFDACIQIKMGAEASCIDDCTDDGELRDEPGMPWIKCFFLSPGDALKGY